MILTNSSYIKLKKYHKKSTAIKYKINKYFKELLEFKSEITEGSGKQGKIFR